MVSVSDRRTGTQRQHTPKDSCFLIMFIVYRMVLFLEITENVSFISFKLLLKLAWTSFQFMPWGGSFRGLGLFVDSIELYMDHSIVEYTASTPQVQMGRTPLMRDTKDTNNIIPNDALR